MTTGPQSVLKHLKKLGASHARFISSRPLVPEERIRRYCYEDKCGCYRRHLTCPPRTGTIAEIKKKLKAFRTGILVQYSENIDVRNDKAALRRTKLALHRIILLTEDYVRHRLVTNNVWGLIGGNCAWCEECAGFRREPCPFPDKARFSLEAIGIDVIALLGNLALDTQFRDDKITWTGMVLVDRELESHVQL